MGASDWIAFGSLAVSLISLLSAVSSNRVATKVTKESNNIQTRLVEIEQEREMYRRNASHQALFVVETEVRIPDDKLLLHVKNLGNGTAHGVMFIVNNKEIMRVPGFQRASRGLSQRLKLARKLSLSSHLPTIREG